MVFTLTFILKSKEQVNTMDRAIFDSHNETVFSHTNYMESFQLKVD